MTEILEETLEEFDMTEGVTYDEIMDEAMPTEEILNQMNIEDPEGEAMVEEVVEKARAIAESKVETVEAVSDDI